MENNSNNNNNNKEKLASELTAHPNPVPEDGIGGRFLL